MHQFHQSLVFFYLPFFLSFFKNIFSLFFYPKETFFAQPPTQLLPVTQNLAPSSTSYSTSPKLFSPPQTPQSPPQKAFQKSPLLRPSLSKAKTLSRGIKVQEKTKEKKEKAKDGGQFSAKKNHVENVEDPEKVLLLDAEREVKIFISSPFKDMNAGINERKR